MQALELASDFLKKALVDVLTSHNSRTKDTKMYFSS